MADVVAVEQVGMQPAFMQGVLEQMGECALAGARQPG
jgi:hypothetical protein